MLSKIYLVVLHTNDEYNIDIAYLSESKANRHCNKLNKKYKTDSFSKWQVDELEVIK